MKLAACALLALVGSSCGRAELARSEPLPTLPRLREPVRALELPVGPISLAELLGRWTDAGGPDVLVVAPGAHARLDPVEIRIPAARVLAPHEIAPFVERALCEHDLALAAAAGSPATLVSVERWPTEWQRACPAQTLAPSMAEQCDAHPALLVQVALPAANLIPPGSLTTVAPLEPPHVARVDTPDRVCLKGRWADVAGVVRELRAREPRLR
jgi:hypothetical protein